MPTSTLVANLEVVSGASASQSLVPNLEVVSGASASKSSIINLEVVSGAAVSASRIINLEILEDAAKAGQPEVILQVLGTPNRLRGELFDWTVNRRSVNKVPLTLVLLDEPITISKYLNYVDEFLGPKIGIGPILDFASLTYTWSLDEVGPWEATIAGLSPNLQPALDGTAKVIKFHFEGLGLILGGWITDHEVDEAGNLILRGDDFATFLAKRSSYYRHYWRGTSGSRMYIWAAGLLLPATYVLDFGPNADGGNAIELTKRFQSQSVAEMWQELNLIHGNHWRINPVGLQVFIDQMGNNSGKVISNIIESDPQAVEQGVIPISSLRYQKSDENLINSILPQGSNNAFGVAVELRHTRQQRKFGYYSDVEFKDITFPQFARSDEIRGEDAIDSIDDETGEVIPATADLNSELGIGASTGANPYPAVYLAYAKRVTFSSEYDFAWAAAFGFAQIYGGGEGQKPIGELRFDLCPDSGGEPDTANPVVTLGMGNYRYMGDMPEVNDSFEDRPTTSPTGAFIAGGDKVNFCEPIWIPDQQNGFKRIAAGSYWAVISRVTSFTRGEAWGPDFIASGVSTWVAGCRMGSGTGSGFGGSSLWYTYPGGTWEEQDITPLIEISGRYNTAADIARYPYIVMAQFAPGIDDTLPTSGQRIMYIRDDDSIAEWGLRERVVSFQNAVDSRQGVQDVAPAADVLYASAVIYLQRHKDRFEYLQFDTVGYFDLPKPGEKVRVVFRGLAENEEGKRVWVDINSDFWVLKITIRIDQGGVTHSFEVATVPENFLDPNAIPYELMRSQARHNNYLAEIEYGTHVGIIRDDF